MANHRLGALRKNSLQSAIRLEVVSLVWVLAETVVSGVAALQAGSIAISAFSLDSAIELISGLVLLVRLYAEFNSGSDHVGARFERIAAAIVGACLFTLSGWIAFKSGQALAAAQAVGVSRLGIVIAALSSVITPWLAREKRRLGLLLDSHALLGDAACSATCGYMAWTLLAGLLLQSLLGWWWVDAVAALGILYFVIQEAWESAVAAWTGSSHAH